MIRLYVSPLAGGHHRLLDVFRRTCAEFTLHPHDDPLVHEVVVNIGDRWWIDPAPEAVAIAAGIPVEACWSSHAAFASGATVSTPCADAVAVAADHEAHPVVLAVTNRNVLVAAAASRAQAYAQIAAALNREGTRTADGLDRLRLMMLRRLAGSITAPEE
ncbi:MAG TPA: hypothetical protein VKJ07_25010 [Mycobacteriales bacterium]|nr:hypothetical protein [Mycobacteriales bacterium]